MVSLGTAYGRSKAVVAAERCAQGKVEELERLLHVPGTWVRDPRRRGVSWVGALQGRAMV